MKLRTLNRILAKHETVYVSEVIKGEQDQEILIDEQEAEEVVTESKANAAAAASSRKGSA